MTVGELVTTKWREDLKTWIDSCEPTPMYQFPQIVLSETLRGLGIWDAEVLEGVVGEESNGSLAIWPDSCSNKEWDDAGIESGQSVRIIVLPKKEGE